MNGSKFLIPVMTGSNLMESFFNDDLFSNFFNGTMPEGSKSYIQDIYDDNGKKVGERRVSTYSSGKTHAPREIISNNFPPMNSYVDESKKLVYEFAVAGYEPDNISFEVNSDNPDFIDLVLSSGMNPVEEKKEEAEENSEEKEATEEVKRVYSYEGFKVKDARTSFRVDSRRYDLESAEVEIKNGVARISFQPKKISFNPKIKK